MEASKKVLSRIPPAWKMSGGLPPVTETIPVTVSIVTETRKPGRPKKAGTPSNAERQRAYRQRKAAERGG